jgi:hypothetical protein
MGSVYIKLEIMDDVAHVVSGVLIYFAMNPVVYTLSALGANNYLPSCDLIIDPRIGTSITEWMVLAVVIISMFTSFARFEIRTGLLTILAVPLALFYTSAITATCSIERTYNFNEWALSTNTTNNATLTFVPQAVDIQWRAAIVYTTLAGILLLVSIRVQDGSITPMFRGRLQRPWLHIVSFVACVGILSDPPHVNKTDALVLCRGGAGNSQKVFDTVNTGYGPLSKYSFIIPISITLVFVVGAMGATLLKRFRVARLCTVASFVTTGVYICMLQYTLRNPGCTVGIKNLGSTQVRLFTGLLVYTWIVRPLTLVPEDLTHDVPPSYSELKNKF